MHNIVITGGVCSGKSSGLSYLQNELTKKGYEVYIVDETATHLIMGNINLNNFNVYDFESCIMKLQYEKEKIYREVINKKKNQNKIIILYDRGIMDCKAFMDENMFNDILNKMNLNQNKVNSLYDAVFHLITAANGAEEFYTLENNLARSETKEEAIKNDKLIMNAWIGHPHLRIIDNSTNFKGKLDRLLNEIYAFLGDPIPNEIERKFLIEEPDFNLISNYTKVNIMQIYLKSSSNEERRIRQRGINGVYTYYYTIKRNTNDTIKRIETEKMISQDEYLKLLIEADNNRKMIIKDRYCFTYKNQYFELDKIDDMYILEIELTNENQEVKIPNFINIIKEVTNDINYRNYNLSKRE